jgi:hypothetical protein
MGIIVGTESIPVKYYGGNKVITDGTSSGSILAANFSSNTRNTRKYANGEHLVLISKHENASLAYKRVSNIIKQPLLESEVVWKAGNVDHESMAYTKVLGGLSPVISAPSRPVADDLALKRLKGKLARDINQFNLLLPVAELKETRSLISSTSQVTSELLKALIELKHGKVKGLASKVGKAWLQFSFAISPTIADTHEAINSLSSYLLRQDHSSTYTGSYEERWSSSGSTATTNTACSGCTWGFKRSQIDHNYKVRYSAGVLFDISSANNYSLPEHFGLEFSSLPSVLWELTVFSWVADYFGTTGAFLEDVFSSPAGNTFYCTKSVKYEMNMKQAVTLNVPSTRTLVRKVEGSVSQKSLIFERTTLSDIPHRALRFKSIDEIGLNSVNKILNLASILVQGK